MHNRSLSRLQSQVLILGRDEQPVGSGFVCGSGQVMTCAHVVSTAIFGSDRHSTSQTPPAGEVKIRFARGEAVARACVNPQGWFPRGGADIEDIAVLSICEGEPLPPDARPVMLASAAPQEMEDLYGLGIHPKQRDGVNLVGRFIGYATGRTDRYAIFSHAADQTVQPGCSGAAMFFAHGAVAGMVVERQQEHTALLIPSDVLARAWPISVVAAGKSAYSSHGEPALKQRLSDQLHVFNRDGEEAEFEVALNAGWSDGKLPVFCTLAAVEDDLPELFEERCFTISLRRCFGDTVDPENFLPVQLPWPAQSDFDIEGAMAALGRRFSRILAEAEADSLSSRRAAARHPLFFYSHVQAANFSSRHRQLAERWNAHLVSLADGPEPGMPIIHMLCIVFPDAETSSLSEKVFRLFRGSPGDIDVTLRQRYERLTEGLSAVRRISPLQRFVKLQAKDYLRDYCRNIRLSQQEQRQLLMNFDNSFPDVSHARLRDLRDWIHRLD